MDKPCQGAFVSRMHSSIIALLDGLGGPELLVIALVALLLFGSKRMPEIGRGIGRAIREFKRATSGVEENIREVLYDEPGRPKLRPPAQRRPFRESAASPAVPPVAASSATPPTPTPHTTVDLNESAPLESPASTDDTPGPDDVTPRTGDTPGRS